jgi:beta-lactamase superfamily II metal-dependent hydrolase
MSIVKSFSVGNGDMFYIEHNSPNFTIIDCCINDGEAGEILSEISARSKKKEVIRLISTHPDDDHVRGLELLDAEIGISNFYCVKNEATKDDMTDSFQKYLELRDSDKAFYIFKNCKRKWMNEKDEAREQSGIGILWPDTSNLSYIDELNDAKYGLSPNNISPIIKYSVKDGATILWMGDLETDFMETIKHELTLPKITVLFAPHHGRDSGKIPASMLEAMDPKIIVVGEAPSKYLHYYPDYNTITQNSAGDIIFNCELGKVHVFTSKEYEADFLDDESMIMDGYHYVGTLNL